MSKHVKLHKPSTKLSRSALAEHSHCPEFPSFSFAYLTKSKNHNFEYFEKNKQNKRQAQADLTAKLIEISRQPWLFWYNAAKKQGLELLSYDAIRFSPSGMVLTPDQKIIVFRFGAGNYRILGTKGNIHSSCATYYIIGFDFDYSAYDHGS